MIDIKGYAGIYEVSSAGKVWSWLNRRWLKPQLLTTGYFQISLSKNKQRKNFMVHRLVADAYLKKPKKGKIQINHKNGKKTDNNYLNLEWVTAKENTKHAKETGLNQEFGEGNGNSKLTEKEVLQIRSKVGLSFTQIGKEFNISRVQVANIVKNKQWRHL